MSNFKKIDSKPSANSLVRSFDWHDAFIREFYLLSPSFVTTTGRSKGGIYSYGALPTAKCLVCSTNQKSPALELMFIEIEEIEIDFSTDLDVGVYWEGQDIIWRFQRTRKRCIRCRAIEYRPLDASVLGDEQRYGFEPVTDDPSSPKP